MATQILDQLKYTSNHDWVLIENDVMTLGITDFAQASLGDIVFVELPEIGATYAKGDSFGVVESIKSVTDLHIPANGEVVEINEQISEQPELCNQAPYESWIIKMKLSSPDQVEGLMTPEAYKAHCESIE